jgi:hypothetical protein
MPRLARTGFVVALAAIALCAADQLYRSAVVDDKGQLHIKLASGKEILPPKGKGQESFGDAWISPDSRTVGWLLMYPYPIPAEAWRGPLGGALVVYRAGHVLHTFHAGQPIWAWEFQDGGKRVAYREAPMHGGSQTCFLGDVDSGRIVAQWWNGEEGPQPEWADLCEPPSLLQSKAVPRQAGFTS